MCLFVHTELAGQTIQQGDELGNKTSTTCYTKLSQATLRRVSSENRCAGFGEYRLAGLSLRPSCC